MRLNFFFTRFGICNVPNGQLADRECRKQKAARNSPPGLNKFGQIIIERRKIRREKFRQIRRNFDEISEIIKVLGM
ncbi:MAG: hypothetical protein ABJA66_07805 [Actinomycetota bacterium]